MYLILKHFYSGSDFLKPADCELDNGLCGWTLVEILPSVEDPNNLVEWIPQASDGKRMVNSGREVSFVDRLFLAYLYCRSYYW